MENVDGRWHHHRMTKRMMYAEEFFGFSCLFCLWWLGGLGTFLTNSNPTNSILKGGGRFLK